MDTIEASDEVSEEFHTSFKHSEGTCLECKFVFRYTGVVCIQEPLPETLHTYISYIPILDSHLYMWRISVRDDPTYNIDRS